jgi:hypothetical protein
MMRSLLEEKLNVIPNVSAKKILNFSSEKRKLPSTTSNLKKHSRHSY